MYNGSLFPYDEELAHIEKRSQQQQQYAHQHKLSALKEETNDQVNTEKKRVFLGCYFVRVCNLPFRHSYVFLNDF